MIIFLLDLESYILNFHALQYKGCAKQNYLRLRMLEHKGRHKLRSSPWSYGLSGKSAKLNVKRPLTHTE